MQLRQPETPLIARIVITAATPAVVGWLPKKFNDIRRGCGRDDPFGPPPAQIRTNVEHMVMGRAVA
jgi:hypothetical protein